MLSTIRLNYFAIVVLILAILLLATWYQWRDHFSDTPDAIIASTKPDYTIETFQSRVFDEKGELHYEMKSLTLAHYPLNDNIEMQNPWVKLYEGEGAPWIIQAEKGLAPSSDQLILSGNVIINGTVGGDDPSEVVDNNQTLEPSQENQQASIPERKQVQMETQTLTLQIENKFAETSDPVVIFTDNNIIESVGLEADLRNDILLLQANVKGSYTVE